MKLLYLAVVTFLAVTVAAGKQEDPQPVPNTECGTTAHVVWYFPGGVLHGTGTDKPDAADEALENASGVVCQICFGGVQCERELVTANINVALTFIINPDGSVTANGFITSAGWADIECLDC